MKHSHKLYLGVAAVAVLTANGAWAADAPVSSAGMTQIETVVVTAEHRSEDIQKTPIAITAVTGAALSSKGITNVTGLNQMVPGLSIASTGNAAQIGIRGIVSTNDTEVGDPAVAFNVDGVYLARSRSALGSFYDINRVEVLRGPQGTLYGRNATAGAINVITNKPSLDGYAMSASLGYGSYNALNTTGMVNIPLTDTLAIRGAFSSDRHDGYSNNAPARPVDNLDAVGGRAEALWQPTNDFKAVLTLDFFHDSGLGSGVVSAHPLGTYAGGTAPYRFPVSHDGYNDETAKGVTLTADWNLHFATLTYVGNYRSDDEHSYGGSAATGPAGTSCATANSADCQNLTFFSLENQTSHELRLGNSEGALKWVLGLYYFHENNNVFFGIAPIAGINSLAFVQPSVAETSKAVFGQATYSITDSFRLTGGLRYTEDNKARTGATMGFGAVVGETYVGGFPLNLNAANFNWSKLNWRAGAEYDLTENSMLYGSVSTGYKAGGYGDGAPPNNNPYRPENVTDYEIGVKNTLFNHHLILNVDGFYDTYKDFQASGIGLVSGQPSLVTINAGAAKIYGVELESQALLTDFDQLNFSVAYLHARFTSFLLPLGDSFHNTAVDYAGDPLSHSPDWTLNMGYQHQFVLGSGASITARGNLQWVDTQNLDYHNFALTQIPSYTRSDLTVTYASADGHWEAMAYVRNLEDNAVLSQAAPDPRATTYAIGMTSGTGHYMPPRTYGVKLTYKY